MLDEFLKVAYETQLRQKSHFELVGLMEGLPVVELRKLAEGTPVAELYGHLDKNAYAEPCGPDGQPKTFLDKFKGTPLFDQAIALEQQELQAEMADAQKRQQRRQESAAEDSLYDMRDRIRVQKRLLELELAKQEAGGGAVGADAVAPPAAPGEPAQGAGALGPAPAAGGPDKMASAFTEKDHQAKGHTPPNAALAAAEKIAFADGLGRSLARNDATRADHAGMLRKTGGAAGAAMAKAAFDLGAIGGALKGLAGSGAAQKALGFAMKNPALVGAGIGAAGGALAGGPDHRLSGALGGAALGGAAGHLAGPALANRAASVAKTPISASLGGAPGAAAAAAKPPPLPIRPPGGAGAGARPPAPFMGGAKPPPLPAAARGQSYGALQPAPSRMPAATHADPRVLLNAPGAVAGAPSLAAPDVRAFAPPPLGQRMMGALQ